MVNVPSVRLRAFLAGSVTLRTATRATCSLTASLPRSSLQTTRNAALMRRSPWLRTLLSAASSLRNPSHSTS